MLDLSLLKKQIGNKPVAVFGLGVSGLSTVKALVSSGVSVVAWDDKEDSQKKAEALGATIHDLNEYNFSQCAFLVLAPGISYTFEPHIIVEKAQSSDIEILSDIELFYRACPDVKTIGVTGTNGKSTTTALMTHALSECGFNVVMGGNIGVAVCDIDVSNDLDFVVLELSSYQLDLCPTFRPDISIILNITPDHLDRHGSMKSYVDAKKIIIEGPGKAIIGIDDDFTNKIFEEVFVKGQRQVTPVSVHVEVPEGIYVSKGRLFANSRGENKLVGDLFDLPTLKGRHNHQNAACVYSVMRGLDIADANILSAFKTYAGLQHRQFLAAEMGNVIYVNDSKATNAEAAAKALSSYDNIYWIVGGRAKDGGLEGLEIFHDKIKKTYVIGECAELFGAWLEHYKFPHEQCGMLDKAVKAAHNDAQSSDQKSVVLLSPATASWDQFTSFEKRGDEFIQSVHALIAQNEE